MFWIEEKIFFYKSVLMLRYWDEKAGEVVDEFYDFHNVGHEPADIQVINSTSNKPR